MVYFRKNTFWFIAHNWLSFLLVAIIMICVCPSVAAQLVEYNKKTVDSLYRIQELADPVERANVFLEIVEYNKPPVDEKMALLDSALQIAKNKNHRNLLYRSYYLKSEFQFSIKKYDSAFALLTMAKSFVKNRAKKNKLK